MLSDLCRHLRNWFYTGEMYKGQITIQNGALLDFDGALKTGQCYQISGSVFNDGVHRYNEDELWDETFNGTVRPMAVPLDVLTLSEEIDAWRQKYETLESPAMGPYTSESFSGYSYTKGGSTSGSGANTGRWQDAFAARLRPYKKL